MFGPATEVKELYIEPPQEGNQKHVLDTIKMVCGWPIVKMYNCFTFLPTRIFPGLQL